MKRYTKDNLPPKPWTKYRKVRLTEAVHIIGPFEVETREGVLSCPDGYLAIDSEGWPYPIAFDEFHKIYEAQTTVQADKTAQGPTKEGNDGIMSTLS